MRKIKNQNERKGHVLVSLPFYSLLVFSELVNMHFKIIKFLEVRTIYKGTKIKRIL